MYIKKITLTLFISFILLLNCRVDLLAMDKQDKESDTFSSPPVKMKGFLELLNSAEQGNKEDHQLLCFLLPLTFELEKWIDPKEILSLLKQKPHVENSNNQLYQDKFVEGLRAAPRNTLKVADLKSALTPFLNAISRGYSPAVINVGEIYIRLFLVNKYSIDQLNAQLLVEAFSEDFPPPHFEERGPRLPEALSYGTQALHSANNPRELNMAASLIVSALTGKWSESDKTVKLIQPISSGDMGVYLEKIQAHIDRFEQKLKKINSFNSIDSERKEFYQQCLEKLKKFMVAYPHKIQNSYLYLPLDSNVLHLSWQGMKISNNLYAISDNTLCLDKPLEDEPVFEVVEFLRDHYQKKDDARISGNMTSLEKAKNKNLFFQKIMDFDKEISRKKMLQLQSNVPIFEALWPKSIYF